MPGERAIVIHGHFYQPPRENPWLEAVEVQDAAAPYHDWNGPTLNEIFSKLFTMSRIRSRGSTRRAAVFGP
jgi:hypothetical protein